MGLLSQFLMRSVRRSLAENRSKRVERMLARGHNLIVRTQAQQMMKQALPLAEDRSARPGFCLF